MNLEMEVLDTIDSPLSNAEGVGATLLALAAGIAVGAILT